MHKWFKKESQSPSGSNRGIREYHVGKCKNITSIIVSQVPPWEIEDIHNHCAFRHCEYAQIQGCAP